MTTPLKAKLNELIDNGFFDFINLPYRHRNHQTISKLCKSSCLNWTSNPAYTKNEINSEKNHETYT